jgi:hypothetical protein
MVKIIKLKTKNPQGTFHNSKGYGNLRMQLWWVLQVELSVISNCTKTILQFMHLKLVLIKKLTIGSHELTRLTMIFDLGEDITFFHILYVVVFTTFALKLFCQIITPKFSSSIILSSNHIQIWHGNDIPWCLIYILWKEFLKVILSFSIKLDLALQILV